MFITLSDDPNSLNSNFHRDEYPGGIEASSSRIRLYGSPARIDILVGRCRQRPVTYKLVS